LARVGEIIKVFCQRQNHISPQYFVGKFGVLKSNANHQIAKGTIHRQNAISRISYLNAEFAEDNAERTIYRYPDSPEAALTDSVSHFSVKIVRLLRAESPKYPSPVRRAG